MLDCTSDQETCIRNPGRTDEIKLIDNVRILTLNPRRCVPTDVSKTNMVTEAAKRHQMDAVLLNGKSTKQSTTSAGKMKRNFRK